MLQELKHYAQREGIESEPGFGPRYARFLIVFNSDGDFLRVIDTKTKTERRGREFAKCPVLSPNKMVSHGLRQLFLDSVDKVALLTKGDPDEKQVTGHQRFVDLLEQAGQALPRCLVLAQALREDTILQSIREQLLEAKAKPTDTAALAILEQEVVVLVEESDWHDWWRGFLASLHQAKGKSTGGKGKKAAADNRMLCFVSGELAEPAATQNKVTGLSDVGGLSAGTVISSFDKDAFGHFGLSKGAIASISVNNVKQITDSLNHLLQHRSKKLAGAKIACWYDRELPPEFEPTFDLFEGADFDDEQPLENDSPEAISQRLMAESSAGRLLDAIRSGNQPELAEASFFSLTLSGNSGRVMFRDWSQGPLEELAQNILHWFEDLAIVSRDGKRIVDRFKLLAVVGATVRDLKDAPSPLIAAIWKAAIGGRSHPIPSTIAAQTLARIRIDVIKGDAPRHARLGLLRAYLLRHPESQQRGFHMTARVDDTVSPKSPADESAYLCGRIMALLDQIQEVALGDVGVGVVQRYYAAASTTPALVLGRMIRNAQVAHFPKARSDQKKAGLAISIERQIQQLMSRMTDTPPKTLDLEQQTLFALGFYQQQAERYTKKTAPAPATSSEAAS